MTYTRKNKTKKHRVFKKGDFYSGDGFLTSVWGPAIWLFLHTMSFNYPNNPSPQQKKQYRDFILSLQYILPCIYCRKNLTKNFIKCPLKWSDMDNRFTFSIYV